MSQRHRALQLIRAALLSGKVPVGELTSERVFAERYLADSGLGRTPVREALAILTQLGIVEQYPQAGFSVRRIDAAEATKVLTLQSATERLIVREAAEQHIDSDELIQVTDELADTASHGENAPALELARTFHMTLAQAADYASAADALGGFRDRYSLFIADSSPLDKGELSEMASVYRDLVLAIDADATGNRGEYILNRLIETEKAFVRERSAGPLDEHGVAPHEPVLQPAGLAADY